MSLRGRQLPKRKSLQTVRMETGKDGKSNELGRFGDARRVFSFLDFAADRVAITPVKVFVVPPFGLLFMELPSRAAVQSCSKEQPQ